MKLTAGILLITIAFSSCLLAIETDEWRWLILTTICILPLKEISQ